MISTAIAIQDATGNAVVDLSSMIKAKNIYKNKNIMTEQEFVEALWDYSTHLASLTATMVTHACLTSDQIKTLTETIKEVESMGKDIE